MHIRRDSLLSQLTAIVKLHPFNLPDAANVKRITQEIGFGVYVSIDKRGLFPLSWNHRKFLFEKIQEKGIPPPEQMIAGTAVSAVAAANDVYGGSLCGAPAIPSTNGVALGHEDEKGHWFYLG